MKGKRLRMRAARLLAVVYVMYVVMSGMAVPGTDGSIKPLLWTKAAGISVTVGNKAALKEAGAGEVFVDVADSNKVAMFRIDKTGSTNASAGYACFDIYSVKYNNQDYYYDPANKGDGSQAGLFYSDASHQWGFCFPQVLTASASIEVQVAMYLNTKQSNFSIYDTSFSPSAQVGEYEQFSAEKLTNINGNINIQYYNYEGNNDIVTKTCSSGGEFNTSNLRFYCLSTDNDHYTYRIQYGEDGFIKSDAPAIFHVWKTDSPTASASIQPGTNRMEIDTNVENAKKYLQVYSYADNGVPVAQSVTTILSYTASKTITGVGKIDFPEESDEDNGFYIPLMGGKNEADQEDVNFQNSISFYMAVNNDEQGYSSHPASSSDKKAGRISCMKYGPKSSSLDTLKVGNTGNITDNLVGTDGKTSTDYAGNVVEVRVGESEAGRAVTEGAPYDDDYVTIDYYGNVTAKKAFDTQKYTLITETKYTKLRLYTTTKTYRYANNLTDTTSTDTPTGVYGTQTWEVSLTLKAADASLSSSEAPTTTEPTTAAPATYKATLSTNNSGTKLTSGGKTATGNNSSISLEAGQIVTITPGASTYGSEAKVSDGTTPVKNSNGTYTFTMPAKAVTVTVTDITLSSISAAVTGTGGDDSLRYSFGNKTAAPANTEILDAFKKSNLNITAILSNGTTTQVASSQASYSVKSNTVGNAVSGGDILTYSGKAVITVAYEGKSADVDYYYTYTTTNQKTLTGISIEAKPGSTISTSQSSPTVYESQSALPSEADIKNQIGTITATYTDSLGNQTKQLIASSAAGVSFKVTTREAGSPTLKDGIYIHNYTSQVTAAYDGKTSNSVTFYYCYKNYSVTCKTVDENGEETTIPSSLRATVSPTTDIAKGTTVTVTTQEDESLSYLKTDIAVKGATKTYTVSNNTFSMPDEPVTVTVTYTKLSDYAVTAPTVTKLSGAPSQAALNSLLGGAYLIPEYKSAKGSKVDLTDGMVTTTLGAAEGVFKNGVTTYTVPVTVVFNGIKKENAFSFTYEVKHSYNASVEQAAGQPSVQIKKGSSYTNKTSGYYGDIIMVVVPEETQKYAFPTVTIKSASGTVIKTIEGPGEETFTMPAENVTITASYEKLTELNITPPNTSNGAYNKDTTKEDLPLGTITAVYGSNSRTKSVAMTRNMYTVGIPEETTTENADGSKTVKTTVPVTIHVEYGEMTKDVTFSYSYSYEVSKDSKTIRIGAVTCGSEALDNSELVKVSQSIADPGDVIRVTIKETAEYAFPVISVKTASKTETLTLTGSGDEKTATYTMANEDAEILVDYKPLTGITLTEPDKTQYEQYTNPGDLDFTGGFLTAIYGDSEDNNKVISLKTEAGVSNGCTFTCTEQAATEEAGIRVIPVKVTITYGGKTVSYQYTYEELCAYSVTLDGVPEDFANKEDVKLSTTGGNYGDELVLFLPADTDDMYAFPAVTVQCGDKVETWEAENGAYRTTITGNMTVSVSYCKLSKLLFTPSASSVYVGTSLPSIDNLSTSKAKLELVYENADEEEGGRRTIPVSGNVSLAYGKETESVTNGRATHTVPVLVTANYKNLVTTESKYSVWYYNYVVSVQDVDGNELSVDKNRAIAGDSITISLTPGMIVSGITANNGLVGYELSEDKTKVVIRLADTMRSDETGYTFTVAYQTVHGVKAPEQAVVVSDKIMKEEELKQALADLNSFDFGSASILVSYDDLEPNQSMELNSPSITKELLPDKTTERESADGTYIERTYVIKATINGKSVEVPIIVKVEKEKQGTSGDASGEGTGQQYPGGTTPGTGDGNSSTGDVENPVTTDLKPGKVTGVKVTAKKRKLTVTWKAADNATAYEIWVSTKKNGGYLKAATVKKSGSKKTYSYTVKKLDDSKLKKGKTYYVKVRAVNVKSKLVTKTVNQTAKSKKNGKLNVTIKSVKNAVSYTVKASTKKKSGYKTYFKFNEIGKKKYTKCSKRQKRNTKYYIKVEAKVETGKRLEGSYSSTAKAKCK